MSSVLLPLLSFLPAIFQVFLGVLTSFLHLGHLAIEPLLRQCVPMEIKDFSYKTLWHACRIATIPSADRNFVEKSLYPVFFRKNLRLLSTLIDSTLYRCHVFVVTYVRAHEYVQDYDFKKKLDRDLVVSSQMNKIEWFACFSFSAFHRGLLQ